MFLHKICDVNIFSTGMLTDFYFKKRGGEILSSLKGEMVS
jgi:hypothetical protein